jgi:hypothetical protein
MHRTARTRLAGLVLAAGLTLFAAAPVAARPLGAEEATALQKSVDTYLGAIGRRDAGQIIAALPPRVLNVFAGATGIEARKLNSTLVEQTETMMKGATFRDLAAEEGALEATETTLADGTEVTWVLVPTRFTMQSDGKRTLNRQPLLAVRENQTWYFLRVDGAERRQLAALAYPFLAEVAMPEARITPME